MNNSLILKERDIVYKLFKELSESKGKVSITKEDFIKFFEANMCKQEYFENFTYEGYSCFETIFSMINLKAEKISKAGIEKKSNHQEVNFLL